MTASVARTTREGLANLGTRSTPTSSTDPEPLPDRTPVSSPGSLGEASARQVDAPRLEDPLLVGEAAEQAPQRRFRRLGDPRRLIPGHPGRRDRGVPPQAD